MRGKKILAIVLFMTLFTCLVSAQVLGDANTDGVVNILDALIVAQYYIGTNPQPFSPPAADVTGCDGTIDILDALLIARFAVGLETGFPCSLLPGNFIVNYTLSGGFAGITDTIYIQSRDGLIKVNDIAGKLNKADIEKLWNALLAINYSTLPVDTVPCCCDLFSHELLISSDHSRVNGYAFWTSCTEMDGKVPPPVLSLAELLRNLASQVR